MYILKSKKDDMLYVGSTDDLRSRIALHNSGKAASTKSRRPFELMYYEAYLAEKDARDREHNLKLRANALTQLRRRISNSLKVH